PRSPENPGARRKAPPTRSARTAILKQRFRQVVVAKRSVSAEPQVVVLRTAKRLIVARQDLEKLSPQHHGWMNERVLLEHVRGHLMMMFTAGGQSDPVSCGINLMSSTSKDRDVGMTAQEFELTAETLGKRSIIGVHSGDELA